GAVAAAVLLGSASMAHAGYKTVDLSPIVNHGFDNGGFYINGVQPQADLPGTTFGNQGSTIPFNVANVVDTLNGGFLNYWYGLDDGSRTNLFGGEVNYSLLNITTPGVRTIYTLADNVFGRQDAYEFSLFLGDENSNFIELDYLGGVNTRDYNTPNCFTTGCTPTPGANVWYDDGRGVQLQEVRWNVPVGFNVKTIILGQQDLVDGGIVAGITLGVPEPATWALMIGGLGVAGAALRRRRTLAAS
ncbi:MAG TPA: PEPxxWA-CTERM sorting domain-containing protein, partial [Phenylobacterium sp.]